MNNEKRHILIKKYQDGLASRSEMNELSLWYQNLADQEGSYPEEETRVHKRMLDRLHREIQKEEKPLWQRYGAAVAAAAILLISAGLYFSQKGDQSIGLQTAGIHPGSNKAVLKLADGKTISLSDATKGNLLAKAGFQVTKTGNGQVVFRSKSSTANREKSELLNTVSTPRGGQYQVILSDGTKVWLNAASSIRFPSVFGNKGNRTVDLIGEAYFEVAKDAAHPFVVHTAFQDVKVLGTHFNVNAYSDELSTKTTLLEGSVKVAAQNGVIYLKPGEQSMLNNGFLKVVPANIEQAVGWKNSLFVFDHDNLENIMKKISRWYDVEVIYLDESVKKEIFSGKVSRFENVSEVLKMLMLTDAVHFKIRERRISAMK